MSYCRPGEDSDLYIYTNGYRIFVYGDREHKSFDVGSEQAVLDYLAELAKGGALVPQRAIDRLTAERDGLPYKTDVQRALEEFTAEEE